MVGYGSSLREAIRPGWEDAYLSYDHLKSLLENIKTLQDDGNLYRLSKATLSESDGDVHGHADGNYEESDLLYILDESNKGEDDIEKQKHSSKIIDRKIQELADKFLSKLRYDIEKVSLFALSRIGSLADALGALRFHYPSTTSSNPPQAQQQAQQQVTQQVSYAGITSSPVLRPIQSYGSFRQTTSSFRSSDFDPNDELSLVLPRKSTRQTSSNSTVSLTKLRLLLATPTHPLFVGNEAVKHITNKNNNKNDKDFTEVDLIDSYTLLAIDLLHILRFLTINAMGVRKILKKYDKCLTNWKNKTNNDDLSSADMESLSSDESLRPFGDLSKEVTTDSAFNFLGDEPDSHLNLLVNGQSISALTASLLTALNLFKQDANKIDNQLQAHERESKLRFVCAMKCILRLRELAEVVNEPFNAFLSRQAMILTGHDLGGLGRNRSRALYVLLLFQPDDIIGLSYEDLIDWQDRLSDHELISFDGTSNLITLEPAGKEELSMGWGGVNDTSMVINLVSVLFYTVNYYIVAPTANRYAIYLGTDGAFGSTLIGASSFAAIFAALLYSWWYNRYTFRSAIMFSATTACLGNLLYSLAINWRSMETALVGRVLVGFGSAEVVNRQLISSCVSFKYMTKASVLFVVASALGMSIGPLLAGILDSVSGRDISTDFHVPFLGGIVFNHVTSPGFLMSFLWLCVLLVTMFVFQEPERIHSSQRHKKIDEDDFGSMAVLDKHYAPQPKASTWSRIKSEIQTTYRLIVHNPALPVTLLLFAFIELADEVLISSCSMVCKRYFGWNGSVAGFLIASLGALVLPAHFVVERSSRIYDDRVIMKNSILFICFSCIMILNYEGLIYDTLLSVRSIEKFSSKEMNSFYNHTSLFQNKTISSSYESSLLPNDRMLRHPLVSYDWGYGHLIYIVSVSAIFMGTIILEGVDTSLMNQVTPSKLNDTFLNTGLLATLVGTFGRVLGDSMITISALIDKKPWSDFVNYTFAPLIPMTIIGFYLVIKYRVYLC